MSTFQDTVLLRRISLFFVYTGANFALRELTHFLL